ncbi:MULTISPECIES: portal protein [unclassified Thioalkalivibrio]|uniref:portal protein n=1 Tax=unclassified Thioalkalivibrio TaxID=2621013 RepID=UPI0003807924|nr:MULTISPECIES: portal protein [unclassified Thioalkalivibrio]
MENITAAARYKRMVGKRDPFLRRAREAATLTIPSLFPPENHSGHDKLPTPYQGLGARGLNNLVAKMTLALMPPNSPFFRLSVDDYTLEKMVEDEGMRAAVEEALGAIERAAMHYIEENGKRVAAGEGLKQLFIAGNVMLYLSPEGRMKVYRLDRYVVRRDPMGSVLEHITKESIAYEALPKNVQEFVESKAQTKGKRKPEDLLDLYTRVYLEDDKWHVYQEIEDKEVPGTRGTYPKDRSPWMPLRFTQIDGEDYGRGYVEEYLGDLKSLEALTKAIIEGSAAAAKVLFFVHPNGVTKVRTVAESESGDVRTGDANDVSVLQMDKFADFRVAMETSNAIESRLSYAFLLNTAVQRAGERVTAEEIRYVAKELEDALGGVYSVLSQEFQRPFVKRVLHDMQQKKKIPALPKGTVTPTITTGLEALGRGHDLQKLDAFILGVQQQLGPEAVAKHLHVDDYLKRRATALGIDIKGLVRTEQEIQQEMAEQKQQEQMEGMAGMAMETGMDMLRETAKGGM